jgi:hypothetical protein
LAPHAHIFLFTGPVLAKLLVRSGWKVTAWGSYHTAPYTLVQALRRLLSGDCKGAIWRAHQEIGAVYGRCINSGPMLYAVAQIAR